MTSLVSTAAQQLLQDGRSVLTSVIPARGFACAAAALVAVLSATHAASAERPALWRFGRDQLCVTNGRVSVSTDGTLAVETPSSRAVVNADTANAGDQIAKLRFKYLGPSRASRLLASDQLRRQIGLKLRAADSCNVIYAMWRIEPEAKVVVSIKLNPGQHAHKQCGAGGYVNLKPQRHRAVQPVRQGESHSLQAVLRGRSLTVVGDGEVVWLGSLPDGVALPEGPVGFRTDNGRFSFEYFGSAPTLPLPPSPRDRAKSTRGRCGIAKED